MFRINHNEIITAKLYNYGYAKGELYVHWDNASKFSADLRIATIDELNVFAYLHFIYYDKTDSKKTNGYDVSLTRCTDDVMRIMVANVGTGATSFCYYQYAQKDMQSIVTQVNELGDCITYVSRDDKCFFNDSRAKHLLQKFVPFLKEIADKRDSTEKNKFINLPNAIINILNVEVQEYKALSNLSTENKINYKRN